MRPVSADRLIVRRSTLAPETGALQIGSFFLPCALGRTGVKHQKREGDGATPQGIWPVRRLFYRPDRVSRPRSGLSAVPLSADMGWCDDPCRIEYNTLIKRPFPGSHEVLWRTDHVYDMFVVLGYNDTPPRAGAGSAIFMHIAKYGLQPTEGCIALTPTHLRVVVSAISARTQIFVT